MPSYKSKNIKPLDIESMTGIKYGCSEGQNNLGCMPEFPSYAEEQLEYHQNKKDMVNHPDHYKTESGLETIDVIEAFTHGLDGIEAVCTANVIKYICRWKKKNGIEDLKKAEWYLKRLIRHMELVEANNKSNIKESN